MWPLCPPEDLYDWQRGEGKTLFDALSTSKDEPTKDEPAGFWRVHWPLALVLAIFLVLGVVYSVVTPIFEAPDEIQHYRFVEHLALTGQLPIQTGRGPSNLAEQEASQPPLYYTLTAALTFWSYGDSPAEINRNPHGTIWQPSGLVAISNTNLVLHSAAEDFPYHGVSLSVHLARWISLLIATVTVASTYVLAWRLSDRNRIIATGAAAACAFLPMFISMSASVNNDNLVVALSSLALVLMVGLLQGRHEAREFAVLGLVLGLGALSKLSAIGLFGLLGVVCLVLAYRERSLPRYIGRGLLALAIAVAVAGWWYVRNLLLYGELLGLNAMIRAVGRRRASLSVWDLIVEMQEVKRSYWGVFGWNNVSMEGWVYLVYDAIALLAALGLLVHLGRSLRRRKIALSGVWVVMAFWPLLVLFALVSWTQMTPASYGRLLFPAISCISVLLLVGLLALMPSRGQGALVWLVAIALFSLAAAAPYQAIIPAYRGYPYHAVPILQQFDNGIELVAIDVGEGWKLVHGERGQVFVEPRVASPPTLTVTVYWRTDKQVGRDYTVMTHILDQNNYKADQHDSAPRNGQRSTTSWLPGEVIADPHQLPQAGSLSPGDYSLVVGLYERSSMVRLPLADGRTYVTVAIVRP